MLKTLVRSFIKNPEKAGFEGEDNDENILYIFRRAGITNVPWLISSLFLFLLPVFFNTFILEVNSGGHFSISAGTIFVINLFWYIFSSGYMFERFLNWFFNVYIITNKRIVDMDFNALLHRKISEAPLRNIEDITYSVTGTIQTLFDFGDINIQTAAEQRELEFEYISNPGKVQDILSDLVSAKRRSYGS